MSVIGGVDHVAIAVADLDEAIETYSKTIGLELRERKIVESQKVEVAVLMAGDARIELLRPTEESSPVKAFIDKRGEGLHHIAFAVPDIEREMERMKAKLRFIGEKPTIGAEGHPIIFIHPKSARGVLIELVEHSKG